MAPTCGSVPVCHPGLVPAPIWEAVSARPAGPLRAVVAEHHAYRQRHVPPARHLGLPSPYLTVIITLDEPLHVARQPDPDQAPATYRALVGGLHTTAAVIAHDGAQSGVQLQLSPLGARALLGVPAGELADLDLDAAHLLGRLADDLHEQMREVCRAWRLLRASHGTVRVADVARAVGWSERHLAARFRTEIGLTPKAAARVIRFDRARRMLPRLPGAVVAATCGYADKSHLVRDFVDFTGLAPRAWLAAEVGNLQAPDTAAGRDWAS